MKDKVNNIKNCDNCIFAKGIVCLVRKSQRHCFDHSEWKLKENKNKDK